MPPESRNPESEPVPTEGTDRRTVLAGAGALMGGGLLAGRIRNRITTGADRTTYRGLNHEGVGGASLSVTDGSLVASGGGDDGGISTDTARTMQWQADVTSTVSNMPVGASLTNEAIGTMDGKPGRSAGTWTLTRTEDAVEFGGQFNSTTMSGDVGYQVMNGTDQALYVEPDPHRRMVIDEDDVPFWIWMFIEFLFPAQVGGGGSAVAACQSMVHLGAETEITVDGETVTGDRVALIETAEGHDHEVYYTTEMRTTGSGLDEVVYDDEDVRRGALFDGTVNFARGPAMLTRTSDTLRVDGGEGTRVWAGSADTIGAALEPVALGDGHRFEVAGVGTVDGADDRSLGEAGVEGTGDRLAVDADFGALGADAVEVTVLDDGSTVGTSTEPAGTVAETEGTPAVAGADGTVGETAGLGLSFDATTTFDLAAGGSLAGDEVDLAPADPAAAATDLAGLDLDGVGTGEFVVVEETIEPN